MSNTVVIEEVRHCKTCDQKTLQRKNTKEMTWWVHIFLVVVTGGLWLIVWVLIALFHSVKKAIFGLFSPWVCERCGKN